ncbi:Co-chaperone protein HscB, mitochondrial [Operophtera brumata]|uniref:Co-chaperone protein HscB, mitochondrial n=1 Tax=Operophtera brumata TaxID=104452 RepID=A0A0L7L2M0_OPEBR|nr:Co-chaperone protein HscB, mitochondrial [Operophtera brumata]
MSIRSLFRNHTKNLVFLRQFRLLSCWSCRKDINNLVSNLFCPNCKALQDPGSSKNYFKIMGVEETYDLNESDLARRFKDLQKYLHPDKYANRKHEEQEISEKYSSLVNEAYKTLLEPLSRGIYMLELRGRNLPENTEVDQEFLMDIMEKNEEVERATTEEEIMSLNQENKAIISKLQKELSKAFFVGDLRTVVRLLSHMKYYSSIDSQIQAAIRNRYPIIAQLLLDAWGNQQFAQHCAGVILTARHVISTAHCFHYALPKYWKIRVGSTFRTRGGVIHNVKTIVHHPDFDNTYYTNDIAVLVVANRINLNANVRQGTLIKQGVEVKPNSLSMLVGWGVREVDSGQPDQLQQTTLLTIDQNVCKERYNTIGAMITDSMMCAGKLNAGGPDGCFGDSGGPLIYKGLVVGLVSFGYSCGHRYYPELAKKKRKLKGIEKKKKKQQDLPKSMYYFS